MSQEPLISVVMGAYNVEDYIEESLSSILTQTHQNFEVHIVDDASKDETYSILCRLAKEDPRIKVYRNEQNLGVGASVNQVKGYVKGDYVARMDADDICLPQRFESQLTYLEQNPEVDLVSSWIRFFGSESRRQFELGCYPLTMPEMRAHAFRGLMFCNPTVMVRSKLYHSEDFSYDPDYTVSEDYELASRLIFNYEFGCISKALLKYRWHGGNVSIKKQKLQEEQSKKIRCRYVKHFCPDWSESELAVYGAMSGEPPLSELTVTELEVGLRLWKDLWHVVQKNDDIDQEYFDTWFFQQQVDNMIRANLNHGKALRRGVFGLMTEAYNSSWVGFLWWIKTWFRQLKSKL